ncbi:hypothetical protein GGTG_07638 [Gaeumannomyces tritici R3-111a-1]|uniref:Dienelactone hydrolase domain-containing protein n=1 Tax=Gaeumannomyces tritici (strain R3-111a-1) TaxID=644352 RepID=J3P290_GAET3|nr:hypothetical protein GGTG_07638 [Gaeumannomyces tritici R3-111a-1]EJT73782.1 hypothetical protein GGTG_07638 [Gaeumannomyces tritici R3-111a-1]
MAGQDTPRGSVTRLHGLDAYVTEPADGRPIRGVVVIVSDAYGWEFPNSRLLADRYADKGGYRVLLPDFFDGHACPTWMVESLRVMMGSGNILSRAYAALWVAYAFIPFVVSQQLLGDAYSTVATFFSAVRAGPEASRGLPVFAAGFSWGARQAVLLAGGSEGPGGRPLVDAVFAGHPASNLDVPADVERAAAPVSFAVGDHDHAVSGDVLARLEAAAKAMGGELRVYGGVGNGFCVGADLAARDAGEAAEDAQEQAIAWFDAHAK